MFFNKFFISISRQNENEENSPDADDDDNNKPPFDDPRNTSHELYNVYPQFYAEDTKKEKDFTIDMSNNECKIFNAGDENEENISNEFICQKIEQPKNLFLSWRV